MKEIFVKDSELRKAAQEGMDEFVGVFYNAISDAVGEIGRASCRERV